MTTDDATHLSSMTFSALRPLAMRWAQRESRNILAHGRPLAPWQMAEARQVGVCSPAKVRILGVDALPEPEDPRVLSAAIAAGLVCSGNESLALGYGILILRPRMGERRILRRELCQVALYESCGSMGAFLSQCLDRIAGLESRITAPLPPDGSACRPAAGRQVRPDA